MTITKSFATCEPCDGTGREPDVDDDGKPCLHEYNHCGGAGIIDHITVDAEPATIVATMTYPAPDPLAPGPASAAHILSALARLERRP